MGMIVLLLIFFNELVLCSKHRHDDWQGDPNFNILSELRHHHCEKLLRGWEFECREVYSPYVCRHFLSENLDFLSQMFKTRYNSLPESVSFKCEAKSVISPLMTIH